MVLNMVNGDQQSDGTMVVSMVNGDPQSDVSGEVHRSSAEGSDCPADAGESFVLVHNSR